MSNTAYTENGARAFATTKSSVLDFFATGGALRQRSADSVIDVFEKAYNENALLATKALFYFRDVRGGQGERQTFRTCLTWLAKTHPETVRANIFSIAEYGRWDDLFCLFDTPLEADMISVIDIQLAHDRKSDKPSLLAKWLKSENASSKETKRIAYRTRKALNLDSRSYRKLLSELRKKIDLVEQHMSTNDWTNIAYGKIPSKAGLQYRNAFKRHDGERYEQFLEDVASGKATINAGTLYPYEIIEKTGYKSWGSIDESDAKTLDVMWGALPDFFDGQQVNGLVVADVSGSMSGRPMDVSISLAMYVAERNTGPFANKFLTFSERPSLVEIRGNNIVEKARNLSQASWDMSTNIEAVFDLILNTAIKLKATPDEMPSHLYIVSDMEFDVATHGHATETLFETISKKYERAEYNMPFLVFWNVNSRNTQQPMSMDQRGFQMVSGCSPSIFKNLLASRYISAYDMMLEVLESERYSPIKLK